MELLSWLNHNFRASMKNAVTWSSVMVLLVKPGRDKYQEQCLRCLKCLNFHNKLL